jgi:hypothetical protein
MDSSSTKKQQQMAPKILSKSKVLSKSKIKRNDASSDPSFYDIVKQQQEHRISPKDPLPPITQGKPQQNDEQEKVDTRKPDVEVSEGNSMPLKLFDGKKQSLNELNAQSMDYIWQRRIKEIFLRMNIGRDDKDDSFVEFDMNLAKADLANTCDRYMENERITLTKQVCFFKV